MTKTTPPKTEKPLADTKQEPSAHKVPSANEEPSTNEKSSAVSEPSVNKKPLVDKKSDQYNKSLVSTNDATTENVFDAKQVFKRLTLYLGRHKRLVVVATFFMVVTALTEVSFAKMIDFIVNDGLVNPQEWFLKWLGLMFFGLMVLRAVLGYIANYSMNKLGRHVTYDIRQDIFGNLITLPTRFFDQHASSENVSKLIYDVEATSSATTDALTILFKDVVSALGLLIYLFYLDWRLTLIFIISFPILFFVTRFSNKRFRRTSKEIQDSMGGIANTVKEASIGQKVIKVYSGQVQELENFTNANKFNLKQNLKRAKISAAVVPVTILAIAPAIATILYVFLNYLRVGPESTGLFISYLVAWGMLMGPIKRLAKVNEKVQIGITAANSVFRVIDAESEKDLGVTEIGKTKGHLRFENVTFSYSDKKDTALVLDDINFEIKPGKRVALVGPSGGGKSTITSLILRFYKQQQGSITLDGHDINEFRLKDLRDQVALVSQETTLFDDTIGRNIMYGMLDKYDESRLNEAIKAAHVDEFLADLPDGLDTVVGEHGLRLSGGQRQRIAIARAIYKDAPILILDEATSALDNKSERYVQDALETLMKGRTSLVIAHRLSTVESSDEIFVLQGGKIAEKGSHKKLIKKGGIYSALHKAQSNNKKGFLFWNRS